MVHCDLLLDLLLQTKQTTMRQVGSELAWLSGEGLEGGEGMEGGQEASANIMISPPPPPPPPKKSTFQTARPTRCLWLLTNLPVCQHWFERGHRLIPLAAGNYLRTRKGRMSLYGTKQNLASLEQKPLQVLVCHEFTLITQNS